MRFTMRPYYYLLLCVPSLIVHGQFQRNWIPTDKWIHHGENLRSSRGHKEEIIGESRKYSIEGADGFKDFLFVIDKLKTHRSKAFVQRRLCCQCLLWKLALDLGHFLSLISLLPSSANTADSLKDLGLNSGQKITLSLPCLDGRSTQLNYVTEPLVTVCAVIDYKQSLLLGEVRCASQK